MHGQLHVRDLHGQPGLAPDGDDLVDGFPEVAILTAHVADVPPARRGRDPREIDHLGRRGVDARVVFEARGQTQRARAQLALEQGAHPPHLFRRGRAAEVRAHHLVADAAVARVSGDVDGGGLPLEPREEIGQRPGRAAVLPGHDRGDPLAHRGQRIAVLEQPAIAVAVGVDEAGRQDEAARVDDGLAGKGAQVPDLYDAVAPQADRARPPRPAQAVHQDRVRDEGRGGPRRDGRGTSDRRRQGERGRARGDQGQGSLSHG